MLLARSLLAAALVAASFTSTEGFALAGSALPALQLRKAGTVCRASRHHASIHMQQRKDLNEHVSSTVEQRTNFNTALSTSFALLAVVLPTAASATPPEWLEPTRSSLDIGLALFSLVFFLRIPLTWYPEMDLSKFPQAIVAWPTEPFCKAVRGFLPPLFGVDISPIFMYGILSFIREIFLGQQGMLTMMAGK